MIRPPSGRANLVNLATFQIRRVRHDGCEPGLVATSFQSGGSGSFIAGAANNAGGLYDAIGGGEFNTNSAGYATIGGGYNNKSATAQYITIGGGRFNIASANDATIGGGVGNSNNAAAATIGGGYSNIASSNNATIGGGQFNNVTGQNATVGAGNTTRPVEIPPPCRGAAAIWHPVIIVLPPASRHRPPTRARSSGRIRKCPVCFHHHKSI